MKAWIERTPKKNSDLNKVNRRKPRIRRGRRFFRADLRDWLSANGWR